MAVDNWSENSDYELIYITTLMGITERRKGHNWERKIRILLSKVFPDIQTSRFASQLTDQLGVDFVNTGKLAVQAKNYGTTPNFNKIFNKEMTVLNRWKVIFWKNNRVRGSNGEYAVMPLVDFISLLETVKNEGEVS